MPSLKDFAAKASSCAVCALPKDLRGQIDDARRDFEQRGPGSYHQRSHIGVASMRRWLSAEGHDVSRGQMETHFEGGHHRQ